MARERPEDRASRRRGATPIAEGIGKRPLLDIQIWIEPPFGGIEPAGWGAVVFAEDGRTPEQLNALIDEAFRALRERIDADLAQAGAALEHLG